MGRRHYRHAIIVDERRPGPLLSFRTRREIRLVYAIIKFLEARDDTSTLQDGFAEAAAAGATPAAFTVSIESGFYLLMAGTAMVAIGGLATLMGVGSADDTAKA